MKRNKSIIVIIGSMLVLAACEKDYFLPAPAIDLNVPVSFASQVQPIFTEDCATSGCHIGSIQAPDLSAGNSYDQLTQLGYVDTTNAEESLLYKRIVDNTKPMPPDGKLSDSEINLILAWIKQGSPNN